METVTYTKSREGEWNIAGPSEMLIEGDNVVVTKRDGSTKTLGVGTVIWRGNGRAIATPCRPYKTRELYSRKARMERGR